MSEGSELAGAVKELTDPSARRVLQTLAAVAMVIVIIGGALFEGTDFVEAKARGAMEPALIRIEDARTAQQVKIDEQSRQIDALTATLDRMSGQLSGIRANVDVLVEHDNERVRKGR